MAALNASAESVDEMVDIFAQRRAAMLKKLDQMDGVTYVTPHGAFYVMMVVDNLYGKKSGEKTIENSIDFAAELLEKEKVAVVPGISFGAEDCVRLSYSLSLQDIEEGLSRIERFVKSLQ